MPIVDGSELDQVLGRIPAGLYVLTAAYEAKRAAVLVHWVQRASGNPLTVSVAVPTGQRITPLIRDSRAFALCQLAAENRYLARRFQTDILSGDSVDSLDFEEAVTGSPLLTRAISCVDCQLLRHVDLDADHDLYVGEVVAVRNYKPGMEPLVLVNGHPHDM
ncbi:MAG: flavin reductase [Phycisphaerales bacterium]|nr:flavin reductase [Phycisphaerales bacterium]